MNRLVEFNKLEKQEELKNEITESWKIAKKVIEDLTSEDNIRELDRLRHEALKIEVVDQNSSKKASEIKADLRRFTNRRLLGNNKDLKQKLNNLVRIPRELEKKVENEISEIEDVLLDKQKVFFANEKAKQYEMESKASESDKGKIETKKVILKGVKQREQIEIKVLDITKVDYKFLMINEAVVKEWAKSQEEPLTPGLEITKIKELRW